jgi:hypothetical protein
VLNAELERRVDERTEELADAKEQLLEPIQELVESDESLVIPCWAHDSQGSARCGNRNIALPQIAAAFVIRLT